MDPFFQESWGNVRLSVLVGISCALAELLPPDLVARNEVLEPGPVESGNEPEREHWLEIRDLCGRVITAIEAISPANKSESGRLAYRQRQQGFLAGGVNLVEIDLIRGGQRVVSVPQDRYPSGASSLVCVVRAQPKGTREIYPCPLREPLPTIRVPLRAGGPDVSVALQPLIDECYRVGRYWLTDGARELDPPLSAEDAAWVQQRLQAAGLQ